MANPEHVKVVRRGADAISAWRLAYPDVRLSLVNADLAELDLQGAGLANANLAQANLKGANLDRANLTAANLRAAYLPDARLAEVVLKGANLMGADLRRANLRGADLRGTTLGAVELGRADLQHALLGRARFGFTWMGEVNFRHAVGLDESIHLTPSSVGADTLRLFQGDVPVKFLRGCGLSDWEIETAKLHDPNLGDHERTNILYRIADFQRGKPVGLYAVFISYSHGDRKFATTLYDALQKEGVRCWLDEHDILPGQKILTRLDEGVRLSEKVLLVCSEASLTSWWVDKEIGFAFEKEQRLWKQRDEETLSLIPLNLDGHLFDWEHPRAPEICERSAADFTEWAKPAQFRKTLTKLIAALRSGDFGAKPPQGGTGN